MTQRDDVLSVLAGKLPICQLVSTFQLKHLSAQQPPLHNHIPAFAALQVLGQRIDLDGIAVRRAHSFDHGWEGTPDSFHYRFICASEEVHVL